jgi:transposase
MKRKKGKTPVCPIKNKLKEFSVEITYQEAIKNGTNMVYVRRKLVEYVRCHSIKAAVRQFKCTRATVKRWLRDPDGDYRNRSCRPKRIPKQTSPDVVMEVLKAHALDGMGAEHLVRQYQLPVSGSTAHRILKKHGKVNLRKPKYKRSQDLHHIKKRLKTFEIMQLDAKTLTDIPFFYPAFIQHRLPTVQWTITCEKSGLTFFCYADGETSLAACTFVVYVIEHLKRYGMTVRKIKTDHGSFAIHKNSVRLTAFQKLLKRYNIDHQPVAHKNQNADVERFHGLVEQYFYAHDVIKSKSHFYQQALERLTWFNTFRLNEGKDWQHPLQILKQDHPKIDPQVALLMPIKLEDHFELYMYKQDANYQPMTFDSFFRDVSPDQKQLILKQVLPLYRTQQGGQEVMTVDEFINIFVKSWE